MKCWCCDKEFKEYDNRHVAEEYRDDAGNYPCEICLEEMHRIDFGYED